MKKCGIFLILALLLAGCGTQETFETVSDEIVTPAAATMQQIVVELPDSAVTPVMQTQSGEIYFCDGYTITRQITESGDLEKTVKSVSGFTPDQLQIMQTQWENAKRYDFVWTAAGETGQMLYRCCILDDGNYHYILTASVDAQQAGQLQETWRRMFDSFCLVSADFPLDTGS